MLLSDFSTCDLSDALLKLGLPHGGLIPDISLVNPDDRTVRIAGPAFTVRFVLTSDDSAPPKPKEHHVDVAPSGSVIFISAPRRMLPIMLDVHPLALTWVTRGEECCLGRAHDCRC